MGFITSATTVTVQAKLTDKGKKKLYESIESNSSGFITKFALGDSDADYNAIELGANTLESGHVPEVSDFKPSLRSYALYQGQYRPGIPLILVNDEYGTDNGITKQFSIGSNAPTNLSFTVKSEWPKSESFTETYKIEILSSGNLSTAGIMAKLFKLEAQTSGGYQFKFMGSASTEELRALIGVSGSGNNTVVPIRIIGRTTSAIITLKVQLIH